MMSGCEGCGLPMALTGTRSLKFDRFRVMPGLTHIPSGPAKRDQALRDELVLQATGTMRPGARAVAGCANGDFEKNPLAVTGVYGQGAITVLTIDAASPSLEQTMSEEDWMAFWDQVAGWNGVYGQVLSSESYRAKPKTADSPVHLPGAPGIETGGECFGACGFDGGDGSTVAY